MYGCQVTLPNWVDFILYPRHVDPRVCRLCRMLNNAAVELLRPLTLMVVIVATWKLFNRLQVLLGSFPMRHPWPLYSFPIFILASAIRR